MKEAIITGKCKACRGAGCFDCNFNKTFSIAFNEGSSSLEIIQLIDDLSERTTSPWEIEILEY